jgi:hypothetical protein
MSIAILVPVLLRRGIVFNLLVHKHFHRLRANSSSIRTQTISQSKEEKAYRRHSVARLNLGGCGADLECISVGLCLAG